jgi:hypothetical protein
MASEKAPASIEYPHPNVEANRRKPNRPYMIEGIPDRVSVVNLIIGTSLLFFFEYSTRYIAENIPSGAAMRSDKAVIVKVFTRAGNKETLSELYSSANRSQDRFGIPFMRIYPIIATAVQTVTAAKLYTMIFKNSEILFALFMALSSFSSRKK